jgi:hypothetical protein
MPFVLETSTHVFQFPHDSGEFNLIKRLRATAQRVIHGLVSILSRTTPSAVAWNTLRRMSVKCRSTSIHGTAVRDVLTSKLTHIIYALFYLLQSFAKTTQMHSRLAEPYNSQFSTDEMAKLEISVTTCLQAPTVCVT